jgi:hypothetical protein
MYRISEKMQGCGQKGQKVWIQPKRKEMKDAAAKQGCLVQTQTTEGVQDNRQELKIIMYNNMRGMFWWTGE